MRCGPAWRWHWYDVYLTCNTQTRWSVWMHTILMFFQTRSLRDHETYILVGAFAAAFRKALHWKMGCKCACIPWAKSCLSSTCARSARSGISQDQQDEWLFEARTWSAGQALERQFFCVWEGRVSVCALFIIETVMLPASGKVNRLSGEKRVPKESAHDVISCISCRQTQTHTHTLYIIVLLPCKTKFYVCVICAFVYFPHIKDCQQRDIWTHMDIISWHDTCNVMQ